MAQRAGGRKRDGGAAPSELDADKPAAPAAPASANSVWAAAAAAPPPRAAAAGWYGPSWNGTVQGAGHGERAGSWQWAAAAAVAWPGRARAKLRRVAGGTLLQACAVQTPRA